MVVSTLGQKATDTAQCQSVSLKNKDTRNNLYGTTVLCSVDIEYPTNSTVVTVGPAV